MRYSIARFCKSCSELVQANFALRYMAALPIALGISIGICSWQEYTADYWRDFNTVRVEQLRNQEGIAVGQPAPPFALMSKDGNDTVTLHSLGRKPVVLIFGSYTCPPFRSQFGSIERLCEQFREQITFCFVYKVESHPGPLVPHSTSMTERAERAEWVCTEANSSLLVLLDDLQNSVADAYHVFDEKAVLIDDGRIVYFTSNEGNPEGPDFRIVEKLRNAIVQLLNQQNATQTLDESSGISPAITQVGASRPQPGSPLRHSASVRCWLVPAEQQCAADRC